MIKNMNLNSGMKILVTSKLEGNMNTNKNFFKDCTDPAEAKIRYMINKRKASEIRGNAFYPEKFMMADQNSKTMEAGSYKIITPSLVEKTNDLWTIDTEQDILILTEETPGVVAGHPVADCPVVIMQDKKTGITAVCHCGAAQVDKLLPMLTADALQDVTRCNEDDIFTYVGPCAGAGWTYTGKPGWAKDDTVWEESIKETENNIYSIDIKRAIVKQLVDRGLHDVTFSGIDTITHPDFYSHSKGTNGNPEKLGRQFVGAYFPQTLKKTR